MNVSTFLTKQHVEYDLIPHRETYDAQRMAEAVHVSGAEVAKTVLLRHGRDYVIAVLPANRTIDFDAVAEILEQDHVQLANELEMADLFPDCELGAMPPFGSQYEMQTIVDQSLVNDDVIVFEGNTHHESIRMRFCDFVAIEHPQLGRIAH